MLRRFWNRLLVRIRKRSAEWRTFAFVACIIVVFTTTYAMILPAITLSTDSAEEAAGFYIEEPVEEAEEWIEETYESDDEGEVNEEEQQEEETDAEISALPDDQAVPDQASEEDGLVVIPETENEDEEIVPDESSESAAENAPEVTEQFLTAEEMVEDGRYIIVRYGDDGNAYAMNQMASRFLSSMM